MTYNDFKAKWLGTPINYDNAYGAQCMDVYRMYVKEVLNIPQSPPVKGAKNVWDTYLPEYFDKISNTPDGVPKQGCIAIWGHGEFGHIGIVDSADKQYLTCFEQNWTQGGTSNDGKGNSEIRRHNYSNVLGWLKFKAPASSDYKGYDLNNADSMKIAVDCLVDLQNGQLVRKTDVDQIIKDGNQKLVDAATTYEKEKAVLTTKIGTLEESLQKLQDTEHTWADVADIYQRKLKAICEEANRNGIQIAVETDENTLVTTLHDYFTLSKADKNFVDIVSTKFSLLSPESVIEALESAQKNKDTIETLNKQIVALKKKETAFKTINLPGGIIIKFYKKTNG